ncbi:hypothetical protein [Agromyces larvae]|uniref:Uncharacterized protein n=1 Tax=Agromyces larvae TaxID=2929802 RepID=A0ABY4C3C5_9MICO|nr:hypothetical protein [Agromyces larvae]UOE45494.1 hypothetical protein MTO99_06980 [Agromyces larvae]
MRIRTIKPEFWRSKTIASLDWETRLVLKGLESYVDDNGVGKDDLALIAADVFPRDLSANPRDTLARLSEAISALCINGLVVRYSVESEDLLYIDRWKSVQRIDKPARGRFPRPDGTFNYESDVIRESYASPRDTLAPVTGEQGNRGTGEQKKNSSSTDVDGASTDASIDALDVPVEAPKVTPFDAFYAEYPRHVGKQAAAKKFAALTRGHPELVGAILDGVHRYATDPNLPDKNYIPHPATWLNQGRWDDEPLPPRVVPMRDRESSLDALMAKYDEEEPDAEEAHRDDARARRAAR